MTSFADILTLIEAPESLERVSQEEVDNLRRQVSALPQEYLDFLQVAGAGDLGNIIIYKSPVAASAVYPAARLHPLAHVAIFADDSQGYCYAFDLEDNGRVIEINPRGVVDRTIEPSFSGFLKTFLRT